MKLFKSVAVTLGVLCCFTVYASETTIYQCEDGERFEAAYPDKDTAILNYGGELKLLKAVVSADGARYAGEDWQWWTKGDQGNLAPLKKGEDYAESVGKTCYMLKPAKVMTNQQTAK
ncbi:MliC family protein [Entomomonas asaccharolytica]|uniref:MliC family protein n=1 Tax=Entomomonas asaccharolytica TaxID=2785331 RepID=A0A974NH81_9GAMM|nr:MliC family protein [Entomomonas asaccharolytica]QQP86312.1 MliC family protein [Entomomonas asaccharolytica]